MFESFPAVWRDFKYGYKYIVEDQHNRTLQTSPFYVDEVTDRQYVDGTHMMMLEWKSLQGGVIV